jgi:hypothetical protein
MRTIFTILTAVLIIGSSSLAFAQSDTGSDNDNPGGFGFKGGVGFSTLNFGNPDQTSTDYRNAMKVGGMLGISYEARLGKVFAVDIEALFANKGSQQKIDLPGDDNRVVLRNNIFTFDIPVSLKFYFGDNFNVYAGPYFSYIMGGNLTARTFVNGNETNKESDGYFSDGVKLDGEYPLNRVDVGANVGLEFVSNGGFGVGARFQKGFLDLTNNDYPLSDNKTVTNTGFQLYLLFRL